MLPATVRVHATSTSRVKVAALTTGPGRTVPKIAVIAAALSPSTTNSSRAEPDSQRRAWNGGSGYERRVVL